MKEVKINISSSEKQGIIKRLNGGNCAPELYGEKSGNNIRQEFAALNIPITRLHDDSLFNPGMKLVDVHQIFANFHADADDPRNYYFAQTDDYIKNCIELGTQVYYRLGTAIEHSVNRYFINPPADTGKWIDICSHIIRHYTEGWAGGFNFKIKYWEIWNEPEVTDMDGVKSNWGGSLDEFNVFYVRVAGELKKRFPHLMIGGPAHGGYNAEVRRTFLKYCAEHKAVLDFYSCHCYKSELYGGILEVPKAARKDLDEHGFKSAELHINEWHYFPCDWYLFRTNKEYKRNMFEAASNTESAAYLCSVLTLWQDLPVDMGGYYTVTNGSFGLFRNAEPTKSYYGMKAFGQLKDFPDRVSAGSSDASVLALAGINAARRTAVLISAFKSGPVQLCVEFDTPITKAEIRLVDEHNSLEVVKVKTEGNTLKLKLLSDSSVALIVRE